jgi:hypothetical protein
VAGSDQAAQISQQGIEVGLDGLKQFRDRRHNTSLVARS